MGWEHQIGVRAPIAQRGAHLVQMAVRVSYRVGSIVFADLGEEEFPLWRVPGPGDTTGRVHCDGCTIGDKPTREERSERQKHGCWIASGIRDYSGTLYARAGQLRQAVRNTSAAIARPKVRREIDNACSGFLRARDPFL